MSWSLAVGSKQVVPDWSAEAVRLRRFLDVITAQVAKQHEKPLQWRSEVMTAQQWSDVEAITAEVLHRRLRSEDGSSLVSGGPSRSVVQGYLDDADDAFVNCQWGLGSDDEWQFTTRLNFFTEVDGSVDGGAKPLNEYPAPWLAALLAEAAASVDAAEGAIRTFAASKALRKVRREASGRVGILTLVPNGIGDAELPTFITAYPCSLGYPDGVVLVADLDRAANNPASLVDDLLGVDDILRMSDFK